MPPSRLATYVLACLLLLGQALGASLPERYADMLTTPRSYSCYRAPRPPVIDGRPDEAAWQLAPVTELSTDIRGGRHLTPAKSTRVRMLWDDEHLYIAAELEEDDIRATLTQRDAIIYHDNDFEVFLDPDGDGRNYFEIENNALGTVMDLMMDRPYRSGGCFFLPWDCRGLQLAVAHEGTLNQSADSDRRWFVEMAIPFASLAHNFKNPREYAVWRMNFSRVQWPHPGKAEENWVWSPTGKVDMHMPERWGYVHFVEAPVGSAPVTPAAPVDESAYRLLWCLFYAQAEHRTEKGCYQRTPEAALALPGDELRELLPQGARLTMEATASTFRARLALPARGECYSLNQNGRFEVEPLSPRVVKNWVWMRLRKDWGEADYRAHFTRLHDCGISGVLFEGYEELPFRLCRESGMEAHLWKWTMNRRELLDTHPEWFAVNRLGESCKDRPAYVDYYRFLCPSQPGVAEYLAEDYARCARLPHVDGIHLDYVRYPDVVLPVGLWKNYGIEQTGELPQYDYCYCALCRERFREQSGRDPLTMPYPMVDASWERYRLDTLTAVVEAIVARLRSEGRYVSAAVFPGPSQARRMVRQDWGRWPLDACFPMLYNGFYHEGVDWIGRSVQEGVRALNGHAVLYAGLMFPDIRGRQFEQALDAAYDNGAAGVSFFDGPDDEHLERLKTYLQKRGFRPAN